MSLLFCMIVVSGGFSVRRRTSQLETRWYQRISRILLRHHWSSASTFLASAFDRAQHSNSTWKIINVFQNIYREIGCALHYYLCLLLFKFLKKNLWWMSCSSYLESVTVNHLMFAGPLFCNFFCEGDKTQNTVMTRHQYFATVGS